MSINYGWKPSRNWSCEAPPLEDLQRLCLFKEAYQFGSRIIISQWK